MNRQALLEASLAAVSQQKGHARIQLQMAQALNNDSLTAFWQSEVDQHERTYCELINWLSELRQAEVRS